MGSGEPRGFVYRPEFVSEHEEAELVEALRRLELGQVRMRGVVARRRVAHVGWLYGVESRRIAPGPPVPDFLLPLRQRAAVLAGVEPEEFEEGLVTEYPPGAGIGWHRDAPAFGTIVGVSLLGACPFRFRQPGTTGRAHSVTLEPRSAYVLAGAARWQWQHSIPPMRSLRYSITFRTLRYGSAPRGVRSASGGSMSDRGTEAMP